MALSMEGVFFDGDWSDWDARLDAFQSTVLSDGMWKKFELIETPPLSPRQDEFSLPDMLSSLVPRESETPPDSEDERDQPLAGVDCMWSSSSSVVTLQPALSSSPSCKNNVQLKFKMGEETSAEKFSQFPFSLNDPINFVQQRAALKRPSDSDGDEEEVDVVSVEPQNRTQPSAPHGTSTIVPPGNGCVSTNIERTVATPLPPALTSPTVRPPLAKRPRRERGALGRLSTLDMDDNDETKRATHNVLERRRREDLKLLYTNLRHCLPDLVSNERAAKVKILEHAYAHISHLKGTRTRQMQEQAYEERRNIYLHDQLAAVRGKAAAAAKV